MIKSYIKIAFRNLLRDRTTTLINVIGLGVSICVAIVIFAILRFEFTYDHHHEDVDSIYRLVRHDLYPEGEVKEGDAKFPLPYALRKDFPEQATVTAAYFLHNAVFSIPADASEGEKPRKFKLETETGIVDSLFPKVFSFNFIAGDDPVEALGRPNTVYLSVTRAETFFGSTDVIGKQLFVNGSIPLTVAGIFEDPPNNTVLPHNVLISYATLDQFVPASTLENWNNIHGAHEVYLKLHPEVSPDRFEELLVDYEEQYNDDEIKSVYYLQPFTDMHFNAEYKTNVGSLSTMFHYSVLFIAVLLLIAASINYINLSTAQAVRRSKEVGIRKVLGGNKRSLAVQFLGETALVTFGAIVLGLIASEILLPYFAGVMNIEIQQSVLFSLEVYLFLAVLFVTVTLLSGLYPAAVVSSYQPVQAIRSKIAASYGRGVSLRKTLVVTQFVISQGMIIATLVVMQQMDFMMESDLGFKKDSIVYMFLPENDSTYIARVKDRLERYPETSDYSISFSPPASGWGMTSSISIKKDGEENRFRTRLIPADTRYIDLYEINLLAGRAIRDTDGMFELIMNETAIKQLNLGTPGEAVGKRLDMWDSTATVIGVAEDFHTFSLENKIEPTIIFHYTTSYNVASVNIAGGSFRKTINRLEEIFNEIYPKYVFEYEFVDESIESFYAGQDRMMKLMSVFALVAIIIGALGLFGLISFLTATKTKEIGIRKALGATIYNILFTISGEFFLLLGIALVIAVPVSYYIMSQWLSEYAYRISIGLDIYLVTIGISLLIAAATVGWKAYRAASLNPVKSLRYE